MSEEECEEGEHDVPWGPVEVEYKDDGTAYIWQEGRCKKCGRMIRLDYNKGLQHAFEGDAPDDELEN